MSSTAFWLEKMSTLTKCIVPTKSSDPPLELRWFAPKDNTENYKDIDKTSTATNFSKGKKIITYLYIHVDCTNLQRQLSSIKVSVI